MAAADTAKLIASLELKDRLSPGIKSANKSLGSLETRAYRVGRNIGTGIANAGKIAAVGVAALASQVALGLDSLIKLEQAEAQTGAVLKSTGQAAGINGQQISELAEKYESLNATIGDEFIRAGENMLLTFTRIRGKAFEPALAATLDLNTAMGKGPEGLTKTAILLGKALNDPTKGLTALTRVGVSFTKKQVDRIKGLQKEGKLYEAQQIILKELNREFGGSFIAQGGTTAGKVAKFTDSIEDLQRALAKALLPTLGKVADKLSTFLGSPPVTQEITKLGEKIAALFSDENINAGAGVLKDLFETVKDIAPAIGAVAKVTGDVVRQSVALFRTLPPEIQKLAIAGLAINKLTGGLVTTLAGGLISAVLKQLVSGVVNVHGASVIVTGAVGAGSGVLPPGGGGAGKLGTAVNLVSKVLIVGMVAEVASLIAAPLVQLGKDLGKGFRPQEFEDFGAAWEKWRAGADWPFGSKNAPEWLGGAPPKPVVEDRSLGEHTGAKTVVQIGGKHYDTTVKQYNAIENLRKDIGTDLGKIQIETSKVVTALNNPNLNLLPKPTTSPGVTTANNPNLKGGAHQGLLDAAIHDQTAVMRGWAQIEDRRLENIAKRLRGLDNALHQTGRETKTATIGAGLAAKNAGATMAAAARAAGLTAKSGGLAAARAIDRKDLSVHLASTTHVGVRFSIREQANAVSSRTVHKIL